MTGRAADSVSIWDGPGWAAPERVERLASRPEEARVRLGPPGVLGHFSRALAQGSIRPETFQEIVQFMQRIERGIVAHVQRGECSPECRGEHHAAREDRP